MTTTTVTSSRRESREQIALTWLIRLRWWAVFGQIVLTIIAYAHLKSNLPWLSMGIAILVVALSNLGLSVWSRLSRPSSEALRALTLSLDVIALTVMLELSGGAANPFSFLYLVHIALAAVSLGGFWSWVLVGESFVLSSYVFGDQIKLSAQDHMGMHLLGMWIAFLVSASFIVYFVRRIRSALDAQDTELQLYQVQTARQEKLAALATLSAGAAHELATPLSTIAVAARELERSLNKMPESAELMDDASLIREQVQRCRNILEQMSSDSGNLSGEVLTVISLGNLIDQSLDEITSPEKVNVIVPVEIEDLVLTTYPRGLIQAIRCLINNAIDASTDDGEIQIIAAQRENHLNIEVRDQGSGMSAEVLDKITEPFFTTKPVGEGMGLGLFLTQSVADQIGGKLIIDSKPNMGTSARLEIPMGVDQTP